MTVVLVAATGCWTVVGLVVVVVAAVTGCWSIVPSATAGVVSGSLLAVVPIVFSAVLSWSAMRDRSTVLDTVM